MGESGRCAGVWVWGDWERCVVCGWEGVQVWMGYWERNLYLICFLFPSAFSLLYFPLLPFLHFCFLSTSFLSSPPFFPPSFLPFLPSFLFLLIRLTQLTLWRPLNLQPDASGGEVPTDKDALRCRAEDQWLRELDSCPTTGTRVKGTPETVTRAGGWSLTFEL